MAESAFGPEVQAIFDAADNRRSKNISVDGQSRQISVPFPSPADWRDSWIYFLMVDRFNNPVRPPASTLLRRNDRPRVNPVPAPQRARCTAFFCLVKSFPPGVINDLVDNA